MQPFVAASRRNKIVRTTKTVLSRWRSRLVNTITSFICSLQSTVSKKERDVLIANEMDYNERVVRQLYTIFQDFDQNGNGAISWAEFQLALEDERMLAFLNALELDMSDAVKVFQIWHRKRRVQSKSLTFCWDVCACVVGPRRLTWWQCKWSRQTI